MSIWAVIPAKDPDLAKSRLAGDLSPETRRQFSIQALDHAIDVLTSVPSIAQCLVVSAARAPLALARLYGAVPVLEAGAAPGTAGGDGPLETDVQQDSSGALNAAIRQGAEIAARGSASALLVVAGDLPLVDAGSVNDLIAALGDRDGLVLAPDRHGRGTNALIVRPPLAIAFAFGPDSLARHLRLARENAVDSQVCTIPALALDVDTAGDIRALADIVHAGHPSENQDGTDESEARTMSLYRILETLGVEVRPAESCAHGR